MRVPLDASNDNRESGNAHPLGVHVLIDGWDAGAEALNDETAVREAVVAAATAAGATVVDVCVHRYSPQGVTAVATLAESHLALHTWPEHGYFAADLFYCGTTDAEDAVRVLVAALGPARVSVKTFPRGPAEHLEPPAAASPATPLRAADGYRAARDGRAAAGGPAAIDDSGPGALR